MFPRTSMHVIQLSLGLTCIGWQLAVPTLSSCQSLSGTFAGQIVEGELTRFSRGSHVLIIV